MMEEESIRNEYSTKTSMEHVLIRRHIIASDQNKIKEFGCKSNCQLRKLTNKGAIYLMLVWNFLIFSAIVHLIADYNNITEVYLLIVGLTLPFAGWLADIRFGRYKMIRWSMWIMWTASMLATASSIVA